MVTAADIACTAGCLFGVCAVAPHAPRVTAVVPDGSGGITPFSTVRITGVNFGDPDDVVHVTIGGAEAEIVEIVPPDTIVVVVPAVAAGVADVVVSNGELEGFAQPLTIEPPAPIGQADTFADTLALLDTAFERFLALDLSSIYGDDDPDPIATRARHADGDADSHHGPSVSNPDRERDANRHGRRSACPDPPQQHLADAARHPRWQSAGRQQYLRRPRQCDDRRPRRHGRHRAPLHRRFIGHADTREHQHQRRAGRSGRSRTLRRGQHLLHLRRRRGAHDQGNLFPLNDGPIVPATGEGTSTRNFNNGFSCNESPCVTTEFEFFVTVRDAAGQESPFASILITSLGTQ